MNEIDMHMRQLLVQYNAPLIYYAKLSCRRLHLNHFLISFSSAFVM
jgi:hypothetical protein